MLHWSPIDINNTLILNEVDSTNLFALEKVKDGTAKHGDVVIAKQQTAGRGQMGSIWQSKKNSDINMSFVVLHDGSDSNGLALMNMAVSLAVRNCVKSYCKKDVFVKWANDIYLDDKKISGILIENVWLGSQWKASVIGIGLNVNTTLFPIEIKHATSLALQNNHHFLIDEVVENLLKNLKIFLNTVLANPGAILSAYNEHLFKKGAIVPFETDKNVKKYKIKDVRIDGKIGLICEECLEYFGYGLVKMKVD